MSNALLPLNLEAPCIVWPGSVSPEGYGRLRRHDYAHRVAWEEASGEPIPAGLTVDHVCRTRACVNTDHLEIVMNAENIRRGSSPWAVNARKTLCVNGHEFTPENTLIHGGTRECRECANAAKRAAYHADPTRYHEEVACPICGGRFSRPRAGSRSETCGYRCGWVLRKRRAGG